MNTDLHEFYSNIDRAFFIDGENKAYADWDTPLSIGLGQTISQPSLVYRMTELLDLDKKHKVLEIGTGSGYQTAFLAEFAGEVYSIERLEELSLKAQKRLSTLGYKNVAFRIGDGSLGWEDHAPYDRIIVTAGAGEVPDPLVRQLKSGGMLVIPVGIKGMQQLVIVEKDDKDQVNAHTVGEVTFVELVGEYGWKKQPDKTINS